MYAALSLSINISYEFSRIKQKMKINYINLQQPNEFFQFIDCNEPQHEEKK